MISLAITGQPTNGDRAGWLPPASDTTLYVSGGPKELDSKLGAISEALPGSCYAASRCGCAAK
jgi:hypothetical protein